MTRIRLLQYTQSQSLQAEHFTELNGLDSTMKHEIDTWGQQVDTRHFANFQEGKKTVPFFNI